MLAEAVVNALRPTPRGWAYALIVGAAAGLGFATGTTWLILVAAALALPAGLPALAAYYLGYGLLAQLPGADRSRASGSAACSIEGDCRLSTAGDPATWFAITTDVFGVLALTAAALVNVMALRWLLATAARRRTSPAR